MSQEGRAIAIANLIRIHGPHRAVELVKEADERHRELGEHLRESAEQVRSWPSEDQRSQGIRGEEPPRHG